jgi:hypothetical protein
MEYEEPGSNSRVSRAVGIFKRCPECGVSNPRGTIMDCNSLREFTISGMCQKCQDDFFGDAAPCEPGCRCRVTNEENNTDANTGREDVD